MVDAELSRSSRVNLPAAVTVHERINLLTTLPDACIVMLGGFGTLAETTMWFHTNQMAQKFGGKVRPMIFVGEEWKHLMDEICNGLDLTKQQGGESFVYFVTTLEEAETILRSL